MVDRIDLQNDALKTLRVDVHALYWKACWTKWK